MDAVYEYEYPHPAVTTDIVVFTIRDDALRVLLIKRAEDPYLGSWALPGGFVEISEGLAEAAERELCEETGVSGVYLEQLFTFGKPDRDPRERVITVAYYALVPSGRIEIRAASDAEAVGWFALDELPTLAFDHQQILDMALERLRVKLDSSTIALQLMAKEFTLTELQSAYELILGEPLDKRNFRKRILALQAIEETGQERREGAHRPAKLYRAVDPETVQITR